METQPPDVHASVTYDARNHSHWNKGGLTKCEVMSNAHRDIPILWYMPMGREGTLIMGEI